MRVFFFFFKQKTAYEMRISDWSSDVCSSDLVEQRPRCGEARPGEFTGLQEIVGGHAAAARGQPEPCERAEDDIGERREAAEDEGERADIENLLQEPAEDVVLAAHRPEQAGKRDVDADQDGRRSEEHTSELQSLMRISSAVFCLKKKK